MREGRVAFKYTGVGGGFKERVEKSGVQWKCQEYRQEGSQTGSVALQKEGFPCDLLMVNNENE